MTVTAELDAFTLVLVAGAYLLGGAALLAVVNMLLKGLTLSAAASFAKKGAWQKSVQEFMVRLKPSVVNLLGTDHFTVKLEHILLASILIVLVGMWRTSFVQAELMRKEARAAAKAAAEKKEKKAVTTKAD